MVRLYKRGVLSCTAALIAATCFAPGVALATPSAVNAGLSGQQDTPVEIQELSDSDNNVINGTESQPQESTGSSVVVESTVESGGGNEDSEINSVPSTPQNDETSDNLAGDKGPGTPSQGGSLADGNELEGDGGVSDGTPVEDGLPVEEGSESVPTIPADDDSLTTVPSEPAGDNALSGDTNVQDDSTTAETVNESTVNEVVEEEIGSNSDGKLVKDENGVKFVKNDGTPLQNTVVEINGVQYYLGADGYAQTGLVESNGSLYFIDEETYNKVTGWSDPLADGTRYYFSADRNGAAAKNWWILDGKYYYFDVNTGLTLQGSQWISNKLYNFLGDGSAQIGWSADHRTYYAKNNKGAAALGKWWIDDRLYFFDGDRLAISGWKNWDNGTKSYFADNTSFAAAKGRWTIDGKVYFFNDGRLAIKGWYIWDDNSRSYFATSTDRAAAKGWWSIGGKRYYFRTTTRKTLSGKWKVDGNFYFFNSDGTYHTGWLTWKNDKVSYSGSNGILYTGSHIVDGVRVDFGSNGLGELDARVNMVVKAQKLTSDTNYVILVDTGSHYVGVFARDDDGSWNLTNNYWRCSTGMPGMEIFGTYATSDHGEHFGESSGYTAWWWTRIHKGVLFHSTLYYPYSNTSHMDNRLGLDISHGCIRLNINNAKWIYDNIKPGTTVQIYKSKF
ncbi:L,D-transpeptidase family protein [Collinsella tanakaei]|uniref:L,D-transpeptidase family protein n=1 Tax=Collinsella tanakaei TaxID=626935 RepID=UPI001EFF7749|nr:L,D-transpeptidase family protein [Collinsella tanakaei]MCF2621000.1 L,D-transpeptidase family protein [Collinsella tanakaei]